MNFFSIPTFKIKLLISLLNVIYISIILPCTCRVATASNVLRVRGVSLENSPKYVVKETFTCFDGSGTFPFSYVNDDYCDCNDGSDEPGTNACVTVFYCNNNGHVGKYIPSSFVNDNVCDCCDASDEYKSNASCVDNCLELAESAKREAEIMAEVQKRGFSICLSMSEQGKQLKIAQKARIEELGKEKEVAEVERNEKLSLKNNFEQLENAALAKYREADEKIKEEKAREEQERSLEEAKEAFAKMDLDGDGKLTPAELRENSVFDTNRNGEVSDDEVQFYLHQEEHVDLDHFTSKSWPLVRPLYKAGQQVFTPPTSTEVPVIQDAPELEEREIVQEDDPDAYNFDPEVDEREDIREDEMEKDYDDDLDVDEGEELHHEEQEEEKKAEETIESLYDPETQELVNAAKDAREEFSKADRKLNDLTQEIDRLTSDLELDYGVKEEFRVLKESCFEYTDREYLYKLCPFNRATQQSKNGGSETRLGTWGSWTGPPNDVYGAMKYTKGQDCWNGPQRSAEVRLTCGSTSEITSVTEPNRCEYLFLFTTPAICKPISGPEGTTDDHEEL